MSAWLPVGGSVPGSGGPPPTPDADANSIWTSLIHDAGVAVMILDANATILYANDRAHECLGVRPGPVVGLNYADAAPTDAGRERTDLVRRVASTGQSVVLENTVAGCRRRTALRLLPGDPPRVLMVCRPAYAEPIRDKAHAAEYVEAKNHERGDLDTLTPREIEILRLIGKGLATSEIAKALHRSEKTVEWHRVSIGNKLRVSNRVELARIAIRAGIVGISDDALALPT
ncbi:MAG: PAS domain-containing protein [Phycisphaeraceae bacterium]|nr:MAG: PAS domain-containing protein [Phycisphaeraceae bacterium]